MGGEVGEPGGTAGESQQDQGSARAASCGVNSAIGREVRDDDDAVSRALEAMQAARDAWHARHQRQDL